MNQLLANPPPTVESPKVDDRSDPNRWWARAFGGMFLLGSVANAALVSGAKHSYDSFADGSYWAFIERAWHSVLVPNVAVFIPLLAAFEAAVGVLILVRSTRRLGIASAIAFHAALMLFGWGFWVWSVPIVVLLGCFWRLETRRVVVGDEQAEEPTQERAIRG